MYCGYLHLDVVNRILLIYTLINVNVLLKLSCDVGNITLEEDYVFTVFPQKTRIFLLELGCLCKSIYWEGNNAMDCFVSWEKEISSLTPKMAVDARNYSRRI